MDTPMDDEAQWEPPRPDVLRRRQAGDNEVPASVAFDALVTSTGDLAIFVCGLKVFSNGVELTIEVRARKLTADRPLGLSDALHGPGRTPVLVGVEFSDGRRGSNVAEDLMSGPTSAPSLWPGGGQAGQRSASMTLFLSPLPPPGDLRLVCAWQAEGIADTFTALPTDRILDAARRVTQLWPWEPEEHDVMEPTYPEIPAGSWFAAELRRHT